MSESTNVPAVSEKLANLRGLLERAKPKLAAVTPKHLTAERLIRIALVATSRQPRLLDCSPQSLLRCVMDAGQLGLVPGQLHGGAHLVPFKNRQTGCMEATLIPDYRGLIKLARQSAEIESVEAHVVHQKDGFEARYGLRPTLDHAPSLADDPGPVVACYAIARFKSGAAQFDLMTLKELEAIRQRSRAAEAGPWVTDTEEMYRKTVVKRLCKYLPQSPELERALALETAAETETPALREEEADEIEIAAPAGATARVKAALGVSDRPQQGVEPPEAASMSSKRGRPKKTPPAPEPAAEMPLSVGLPRVEEPEPGTPEVNPFDGFDRRRAVGEIATVMGDLPSPMVERICQGLGLSATEWQVGTDAQLETLFGRLIQAKGAKPLFGETPKREATPR